MTKAGFIAAQSAINGEAVPEDAFNLIKLSPDSVDNDHYVRMGIELSSAKQYNHILKNSIDTTSDDYVIFEVYTTKPGSGPSSNLQSNTKIIRTKVYLDYNSIVSVFVARRLSVADNITELGL